MKAMLRDDPSLARAEYAYLQPLHYAVQGGTRRDGPSAARRRSESARGGLVGRPLGDDTPLARARDRELPTIVRVLEDAATKPLADVPARQERRQTRVANSNAAMSGFGHPATPSAR